MKCINCKTSVADRPLYRSGSMGEAPEWMCMPCMEKLHPELAKNQKDDQSDFEKDIIPKLYPSAPSTI